MSGENEQENESYYDTSSSIQQELPLFNPNAPKEEAEEKPKTLLIKKEPNLASKESVEEAPETPKSSGLLIKKSAPSSSPLILKSAETLAAEAEESEGNNPIETGSFKDEYASEFHEEKSLEETEEYYDQLEEDFVEQDEPVEVSTAPSSGLIFKSNERVELASSEEEIEEDSPVEVGEPEEDPTRLLLKKATSYMQDEEPPAEIEEPVAQEDDLIDEPVAEESQNELIDDTLNAPKKVVTLQEFPRREVEDISDSFRLSADETVDPTPLEDEDEVGEVKTFKTLDYATVGEILSEARENHEMSVDEVVQSTRIRHTYVNALENNILEDLPEKVYTLGYIRQLCREYGISHDEVKETYLKQCGEDLGATHSQHTVNLEHDDVATRASSPGGKATSIVIALVVVGILAFLSFAGYKKLTQPVVQSNVSMEELEELDYSHFRQPMDLPLIELEVPTK